MPPCNVCQNPTLCTERCHAYAEQLKSCEASGQMTAQEVSAHVEAGEMPYPDQTVMETEAERGNCLQATLAAILGRPLETIPHFVSIYPQGDDWWDRMCGWLYEEGYLLRYPPVDQRNGELLPLCGMGGWSERGFPHIVVGNTATGLMVHDPHPSRAGITKVDYTVLLYRRKDAPKGEAGEMEAGKESRVSILGLAQRDCVVPGRCDIDKRVSMPAAGADEEAAGVVHFRGDGAEQSREFAAAAGPHGGDGTTGLRRNFDGGKDAR